MKPRGVAVLLSLLTLFFGAASGLDLLEGDPDSQTDFFQYSEYFSMDSPPSGDGVESYSLSGREPSALYLGDQLISYSTYKATYAQNNALWIQGSSNWAQYVACPLGAYLWLITYAPNGRMTDFYEIYPDKSVHYDQYNEFPGYNRIAFHADTVGRHILFFVSDSRPSNVVVIDVRSAVFPPGPEPSPPTGYTTITFKSSWLRGYSVYANGNYVGTEGQGGDLRDGKYRLTLPGDQYYVLTLSSTGRDYSERGTFSSGYSYTLTI